MSGRIHHSAADVLRYLLIELGLGSLPENAAAWPIHVGAEPSTPDNCITLRDTGTTPEGRHNIDGEVQEHYNVQVRIRAQNHAPGFDKADAIKDSLDKSIYLDTVAIGTARYTVYAVSRTSGVLPLGKESTSDRWLFTINASVSLRQVA